MTIGGWSDKALWPQHPPECLACGTANPASMGLRLRRDGDRVVGQVTLSAWHQGATGYVHGGMTAMLLDEALGKAAHLGGRRAVTAHLEFDLKAPAFVGVPLTVEAWTEPRPGDNRRIRPRGVVTDPDGKVLAEASGIWVAVEDSHYDAGRANTAS